jgi:hypothetical protein
MAKAKKEVITIKQLKSVTLDLSAHEVATLYYILINTGGSPTNSPRKHSQAILEELYKLGITETGNNPIGLIDHKHENISFNDNTLNKLDKLVEVISK